MLDNVRRQEIIFHLSQWIQIIRVGEEGKKLVLEGSLLPGSTLGEIEQNSIGIIRSIRLVNTPDYMRFYIRPYTRPALPWINLGLLLATIVTTLFAGALMEGANPLEQPVKLLKGIPFSLTLMLILGVHELGHFLTARKHQVDATLPYFIPAPTFIGTFGAFIKMRSPVRQRRALIEIGAAGPFAGFIVALPALFIGLYFSKIVPTAGTAGLHLGDSLLMKIASALIFPGLTDEQDILLHPVGFAAWIGLLVTMLNLLPIGQLDGGHIAFALLNKYYQPIAYSAIGGAILLSYFSRSLNWLVWVTLVFFLVKVKHPPVYDLETPLTWREKLIGIGALVIFVLTFVPVPFRI